MSDVAGTRPALWFLTPPAPDRWQAFAAYFADRGYRCYIWPMTEALALPDSLPDSLPVLDADRVIVAWRMFPRRLPSYPPLKAWALLAPSGRHLLKLWRRAPSGPGWIGLGSRQGLVVRVAALPFRFSARGTVHAFEGLGVDLPFAPGWERVAYALRRWLEGVACGDEGGAGDAGRRWTVSPFLACSW
jgi:hypothetical protein